MGREGILPRIFGRTHATHKSPFVATIFVALMVVMITSLFAFGAAGGGQRAELGFDESSPLTALLQLGTWMPFQGNALLFPLMAVVGLAIIVYFLRDGTGRLPLVEDVPRADPRGRRPSRSRST